MKSIDYKPEEIATGFTIEHSMHGIKETLFVRDVVFRAGRGLYFETRRADGVLGPTIYPHPDRAVKVIAAVPVEEIPYGVTWDYPYARRVRF